MVSPSGLAFCFSLVYNEPHIIKSKPGSEGCSAPHQHQHGWSADPDQETRTNIDQVERSSHVHTKYAWQLWSCGRGLMRPFRVYKCSTV